MKNLFLTFLPNRVRRNYLGGADIDWFEGVQKGVDGDHPEEWVASLVEAHNPGLYPIPNEGYSTCKINDKIVLFKDAIAANPEFYLGKKYYHDKGLDLGFLFKILDSSMRLHVQAHPTADFAKKYLNSKYGKLECYYILYVREDTNPYIRLGFQHPPTKEEWKRIIEEQDIEAMNACFDRVPVKEGEIWYIPGGVPHAIGENILMLEIMEPSDLVVRCEYEREGVVVPPDARFMGRGLDFCLNIFDYSKYTLEQIRQKFCILPNVVEENENYKLEELIGINIAKSFTVQRLTIQKGSVLIKGGLPRVCFVTKGKVTLNHSNNYKTIERGNSVFVAAEVSDFHIKCEENAEVCIVQSENPN